MGFFVLEDEPKLLERKRTERLGRLPNLPNTKAYKNKTQMPNIFRLHYKINMLF
ncbi:hypothetical protein SAMN03080602_00221 [Arenibacter troitsensis]|uniref:Uncharacterized protein n=1 Tax=Arenibacter troitsensis TaxID=188872 RepID=A0A1X7HYQ4_9FLAO|nr:hypothetical protein SAMN03080602_00221 [Arenibacter troitsensis]